MTKIPAPSATASPAAKGSPAIDKRVRDAQLRSLLELNPQLLVDGTLTAAGFLADDVDTAGTMREVCPYCKDTPLQLIIRRKHVIRSHLFCEKCTRCFDAILPNGRSAFALSNVPIS